MNKRLMKKYLLLFIPFVSGMLLFSFGVYNIVSSLLLFVGGYIFLKNIFDYRKIKKNKNIVENENKMESSKKNSYKSYDSVIGLKRTRRYERIRKRIKNIDF